MKKATFGAGCFWGVEAAFRQVPGVVEVAVGYGGGTLPDPTYRDVCSGRTGHAEVVEVDYDPAKVAFDRLLDVFWQVHDPTTLNRQGPDVGTQYRSAIFVHDADRRPRRPASKEAAQAVGPVPPADRHRDHPGLALLTGPRSITSGTSRSTAWSVPH